MDIFLNAVRKKFRFDTGSVGALTTEQLFDLPLTSTTGKANLNDIAIRLADSLDRLGARSFVASAQPDPGRTSIAERLDVVKAVIEIKQIENAAVLAERNRRDERTRLLEAIEAADRRELGSKSAAELRADLAKLG